MTNPEDKVIEAIKEAWREQDEIVDWQLARGKNWAKQEPPSPTYEKMYGHSERVVDADYCDYYDEFVPTAIVHDEDKGWRPENSRFRRN